jgi:hypothetical protein
MTTRTAGTATAIIITTLAALMFGASPAHAQTPPPTTPATTVAVPVPVAPPGDPTPPVTLADTKPPDGASLIPDAGVGAYPTRNYDIGYDEGAPNHIGRKILGFLTQAAWTLNKIVVSVVLWFAGWAFRFDVIGPLQGPIITLAQAWNTALVGPLRLSHLIWFAVVVVAGWRVLRGRTLAAVAELAVSVLALAAATVISSNPAGYINGATTTLRQSTGAVLSISRGQPPDDNPATAAQMVDPMRAGLHKMLIEEPYEIINWGSVVPANCRAALNDILAKGPWDHSDSPRNAMGNAGCKTQGGFNAAPSFDRLASASMAAAVSLIVLGLLLAAVITMLVASVFFIVRFSFLHLALLGFQAPGGGRSFAWGWLVGLIKDFGIVTGMAFVISFLMTISTALLATPGSGIAERFTLLLIASGSMFVFRKRAIVSAGHFSERLRHTLGSWRPASQPGTQWSRPNNDAPGSTGYGLRQRSLEVVRDAPGVQFGQRVGERALGNRLARIGSHKRAYQQRTTQRTAAGPATSEQSAA